MKQWLMLVYKIPREPTAGRVYVWRKLQQLGAVLLQDAVWVLPYTSRTQHQFQWLATEIEEIGGEATLWRSEFALDGQEEGLVQRFEAEVNETYRQILKALKGRKANLPALARQYQQAQARDYFHSELGKQVRQTLLAARGGSSGEE